MASPSSPALQRLHHLDASSPNFHDKLHNVLYGEEYANCVPNLKVDDLVWLVEYLDKALDGLDPSAVAFRKCLRELRSVCGANAILPTSYMLLTDLVNIDSIPFASGAYGDVYHGTLNSSRVCIKRIRVYHLGHERATKAFCQEAVMWKYLKHPNILPLLGVTISSLELVSNWMAGGTLPEYIGKYSDVNRIELLCEVAYGLHYLHSRNVIHGGIKGANILVDDSGHVRIADFGEITVVKDEDFVEDDPSRFTFTPRWAAPEVIKGEANSKESDIFSFAMVMIEVFTGTIPFSSDAYPLAMFSIIQGRRPSRPTHPTFTENLWTLMQCCWGHNPRLRPDASEVLQILLTPVVPQAWKRLISDMFSTNERISLITSIFSDPDEVKVLEHLSGNDAQAFVEVIDELLDKLPQQIYKDCLRYLYKTCGRHIILPKSLAIPLCYNPMEIPQTHGGFADVWKGQYNGREVAAKALRVSLTSNFDRIRRRFCKEVVAWKALRHPNVLPLIGVTMTERQFVMVSEWMKNGNINTFVKAHTDVNRLELLRDVTAGLVYMHDQGVVHGDLKGANILINSDGHACIADFSLLMVISDQQTFLATCIAGGTIPWMSPELLDPQSFGLEKCRPTKESDRYALGMVIYEILSGRVPFEPPMASVLRIVLGERPERPQGAQGAWFTDSIWGMLELCWKPRPNERPSLNKVLRCLQNAMQLPKPYWSGDVETAADGQLGVTTASSSSASIACHGQLPDPPQTGNLREERIVDQLARRARKFFKLR